MRGSALRARLRGTALAVALGGALALAGCSTEDESVVPPACLESPETLARALERAPEPVTLNGTGLSECLTPASEPGDVQAVGFSFTEVAVELAREARERPEGRAALELGYLVGAVRARARETQGIHDELVRRLDQELAGVETGSDAFEVGERAGRTTG